MGREEGQRRRGSVSSLATKADTTDAPRLQVGADGTALSAQHVVTGRGAIVGKSSSGKSNTATVVAEELLELGIPIAIIDPEGEYVALKDEYAIVHFGDRPSCDVTGGPDVARELAKRAVKESLPVVVDVSGWEGEQQQEIVGAFASALFNAQIRHEMPMLLLVDEGHTFIPEREKTAASESLIKIAKRGRKRGLGICVISQRPADMKSQYLAQADWLIWHRLSWKNDMGDVRKQLPAGFADDVPRLDAGEAVVDCDFRDGAERLQMRRKRVSDLAATPSIARSLGTAPADLPDDLRPDPDSLESCLGAVEPYCGKTGDERANGLTLPTEVGRHLEIDVGHYATVVEDSGEFYIVGGERDGWSYVTDGQNYPVVPIGARALREMGVTEGDEVRAFVDEDRVRLEVLTP